MSQYSTLKRRPVLFPASAADFSKNLFAMKEEIKALIADDPANKAEYAQAAVEVAIDLQSGLTDWVLTKLVDKAECKAASEDLLAFAADVGADAAAIDAAKATSDPAERMAAMHEAEDLIIGEDWALGPIYFYTQPYMLKSDVDGVFYTPLGYFFFQYASRG